MGTVSSDQSQNIGLQSQIAHWFSALGAKRVEPDFASFLNCEGRVRYAADLTDFEETQPVALVIMTHPGEPKRHQVENQVSLTEAYEEEINGPRSTSVAIPVASFAEFKNLRASLTAAFQSDTDAMTLHGLQIFGMYIAPDKGLPERGPEAYSAAAFSLQEPQLASVNFEPEIQRAKIRNWKSTEGPPTQPAKRLSFAPGTWRAMASSTQLSQYVPR